MKISFLYRYGIISALLLSSTFLVAHTVNAIIEQALFTMPPAAPAASADAARSDLAEDRDEVVRVILRSGLFPLPPNMSVQNGKVLSENRPPPPPLNLSTKLVLRGTASGQGRLASAFIEEVGSKRQALYHIGDQVADSGQLIDVQRSGILIRQGEQEEFLPMRLSEGTGSESLPVASASRPGIPDPKRRIVLDRREVNAAVSNLSKLLSEARATPHFVDGKVAGYQIVPITQDSFFSRIGLLSGDILKRVNGVDVRDPGQVLTLFQQVKDERTVKVDIVRQEQPTTLVYEIR